MGVLTSHRKRNEDPFCKSPNLDLSNFSHLSKKLKVSHSADRTTSSRSAVHRFCLYPEAKQELRRAVHAPTRNTRFGLLNRRWSGSGKVSGCDKMGNQLSSWLRGSKPKAIERVRNVDFREGEDEGRREVGRWRIKGKGKEVIVLDDELTQEDSSIEEMEVGMEIGKGQPFVYGDQGNVSTDLVEKLVDGNCGVGNSRDSISLLERNREDLGLKTFSSSLESNKWGKPPHEQLLGNARRRDKKLQEINFQIQLKEKLLHWHQLLRPQKKVEAVKEDVVKEAFVPLSSEDEREIMHAFANSNRRKTLVSHEKSNIDISGETLRCLKPGAWLNDEVINLYLELLKERENREPHKYLKCHFLNTFFYKKLIGGKGGYNYQAVKRWTTQRKLGYCLSDCDKIFVPIHQEVHWCLGVINKKDQKFQYLDSLGGRDHRVMKVLAMYYTDEVKDKTGKNIDVGSWGHEFVKDLPEQENGYDCGVFMIKYADFYSRGVGLHFNQEHMPYFRQRTAKEILRLKAE